MTNKLVVIINSLNVSKIKKILLYEMKFLVRKYSCLQNLWIGGYRPQIPIHSVLNCICWTPRTKFLGTTLPLSDHYKILELQNYHIYSVTNMSNYPCLCAWHLGKRESWGIDLVIFSFGSSKRWEISFTPQPLLPLSKNPQYPLNSNWKSMGLRHIFREVGL